jgi:hypothetical protein
LNTAVADLTELGSMREFHSGEQNGREPDSVNSTKNWPETRRHKEHFAFYFTEIAAKMSYESCNVHPKIRNYLETLKVFAPYDVARFFPMNCNFRLQG